MTAKAKKKAAKAKTKKFQYLTIEFAGICALVGRKKFASAEVWLPDVMRTAPKPHGSPHYASLVVPTAETQSATADSAVTVPMDPVEYGVWNLDGTTVEFVIDGKVSLPNVTYPKKPAGKRAAPVGMLADVWGASKPAGFEKTPALSCRVVIDQGELAALLPPIKGLKYAFCKGNVPTAAEAKAAREMAWRFRLCIPFEAEAKVIMTRQSDGVVRELAFTRNTNAVIANICQEVGSSKDHFAAYYGLLTGETPMNIRRVGKVKPATGESWPNWEYCIPSSLFEV